MDLKQKRRELDIIAKSITNRDIDIKIAQNCQNPVPGEGDPNAKLMFIGEAPGAQEDKLGKPFIGASGRILDEMLEGIGMKRKDVFITNIVKFRPPKNRDPKPSEIKACLPSLLAQVEVISPLLIVFLGRHSMNVFFPNLKIGQVHGEHIEARVKFSSKLIIEGTFLPLYHPAAALYNGSMRQVLIQDFTKIPKILELIS